MRRLDGPKPLKQTAQATRALVEEVVYVRRGTGPCAEAALPLLRSRVEGAV